MLGSRIIGKGMIASILLFMMAATAMMPCAVGAEDSFIVERHPPGGPITDIVWYEWQAPGNGDVYLHIKNAGMASVTIAIQDNSTEPDTVLLSQTIRFKGDLTAEVDSEVRSVTSGKVYSFSAIPGGAPGGYGTLEVCFESGQPSATVTYTISEMFEAEWGPWWDYRLASSTWDTERLLTDEAGEITYLYSLLHNPVSGGQGLIYAPYRYSVDAVNMPSLNVHEPVLMPTTGSTVEGAAVSMDVYFQYLYETGGDWTNLWIPKWGSDGDFATVYEAPVDPSAWISDMESTILSANDGYMTGTMIEVTMNRAAAEEWLGMPDSVEPLEWWSYVGDDYLADWNSWIWGQGNEVFDIYCGYEWTYDILGTIMKMSLDGDDVVLEIGHVSWGYEALITRWMEHTDVSMHQPYMEDFSMVVDFREGDVDLAYDGVAQWSLHCVDQNNTGLGGHCAWAWEPIALDYIESWPAHPDSDYDQYVGLTYQSWNCGDPCIETEVDYEYTPVEMDLAEYRTLVIVMPTDPVIGYYAEIVDENAIVNVWGGDLSDYTAIQYLGTMSLGYMNLNGNSYSYDPVNNILTIEGPADFANPHPSDPSALYHGGPWIEFNVTPL
ncbi:MAG: hypothetical protein JSU93_06815 [Methanobacteriota archaeon]|nr:MAG: hypothetical protein JSU93_06815 [Euryarchaeota archaeon]